VAGGERARPGETGPTLSRLCGRPRGEAAGRADSSAGVWRVARQVLRWQTRLSMFVLMMHLVDMFNLSPSLTNVTTAVSASGRTLLQVCLAPPPTGPR
jgi:hypothetical protein